MSAIRLASHVRGRGRWRGVRRSVKPCPSGARRSRVIRAPSAGGTERYVSAAKCVACQRASADTWRERNPERHKATSYAWRAASPERAKAACDSWKERNPERYKASRLKRYGLDPATYDQMLADQGGRCAACFRPFKSGKDTHVDHCHTTGTVRELLCWRCNKTLGNVGDDPSLLKSLAAYLEAHRAPKAVQQAAARERDRQAAARQRAGIPAESPNRERVGVSGWDREWDQ